MKDDLVKIARCMMLSKSAGMLPHDVAAKLYEHNPRVGIIMKAAVDASTTAGVGSELYSPVGIAAEFADSVRPLTILGKLNPVKVPFQTSLPFISARTQFSFVGEMEPIPVVAPSFGTSLFFDPKKIAGIVVLSRELLERGSEGEGILKREMTSGLVESMDRILLDDVAADSARPAGILNGADETSAAGAVDGADVDGVASSLAAILLANGSTLERAAYITGPAGALALAMLRGSGGERSFPGISLLGGTLGGLPLLVSASVPADTLILVDGGELLLADDGGVEIELSRQATLSQSTVPASESIWVSTFQEDSVALKIRRTVNWAMRRPAVAFASDFAPPAATTA